jgi:hypothetical protein
MSIAERLHSVAYVIRTESRQRHTGPFDRAKDELLAIAVDCLADEMEHIEAHRVPASARAGLSVVTATDGDAA